MKSINYPHDISNNFLDYFVLLCQKIGVSKDLLGEVSSLKNAHTKDAHNIWEKHFWLFSKIVDIYEQKNTNENYEMQKMEDLKKVFFNLWVNFIKWYMGYLHDSLNLVKQSPMNVYTSEKILDLEDEMQEIMSILQEQNIYTDWKWLKEYLDTLPTRIQEITAEVKAFHIKTQKWTSHNIDKHLEQMKMQAWLNFLHSWELSLESLYHVQRNLQPQFSLSTTTQDIMKSVQATTTQTVVWIWQLDLEDKEILKALKSVQDKQANTVSNFSLQLRNDLHLKFWEAKNDELFYTSLSDILQEANTNDMIALHIVGYEKFHIIWYEKLPNSHHYKLEVEYQMIWSEELHTTILYWDPEKIVAGQQAKVGILQPDKTVKIHFLNINKMSNVWVRIKKEQAYQKQEKQNWFFSHAKQILLNKYNRFFWKKVV